MDNKKYTEDGRIKNPFPKEVKKEPETGKTTIVIQDENVLHSVN